MRKRDWQIIGLIATAGGAAVAVHGITSKRWKDAHTLFSVLSACVALAALTS
jgi:hypothetical protein